MTRNQKIKKRYDRFSYLYDFLETIFENRLFNKWRKSIITELEGNILEIGVGTGKNLPFYTNRARVTAIDFSPKMLIRAKKKLKKLGKTNIKLIEMDVEDLKFSSNAFDYVITTFVWCSVPNPIKGLKEVKRVLKPGEKAIFLEHVLSKNKLIALWEHIHNPITKLLFGFNVNRNTLNNIEKAGFRVIEDRKIALYDVFRIFKLKK